MKALNKIFVSKYGWLLLIAGLLAINYFASIVHFRIDLTKEKRYTLSNVTNRYLSKLDDKVQIDVFLKGDFPSGFRKLAGTTKEFLSLLKDRNSAKIQYRFIAPTETMDDAKTIYGDSLVKMGAIPINLTVQKKEGQSSNIIFPVAVLHYKGKQELVNLYPGASSRISQDEINSAEALMEYQFVKALDKITTDKHPAVAYSMGNGEPTDSRTYQLAESIKKEYQLGLVNLNVLPKIPEAVDVLMIVKPSKQFTEDEKLKIDQFVMRGGKLLCFIDNLYAEQDSLSMKPETIAYDRNLNLTDLFFRYGLRINTDLVMSLECDVLPFVVGGNAANPQMEFLPWNYYPLLVGTNNRITKGLGYVSSRFANSIDTIAVKDVRKEKLLVTSKNSRTISTPALISLNENKTTPEDNQFRRDSIPVAMLLEGKFLSLYRNRLTTVQADTLKAIGESFLPNSEDSKIIVVADGDMLFNEYIPGENPNAAPEPLPMGWNKYTYTEYLKQSSFSKLFVPVANQNFLQNCLEYLTSNPAISETRNKDIVLRLLDSKKVKENKSTWQLINIALPVLLLIICGWFYQEIRKRKYAE
ncbi:MAG: gliding motility-associated ABC transporter substrate-binding protein GldG [Bacteroidetes bacterium]|nr:gliding motility-associated ABC transporter substrate-binding protein GldG [Bacteroidota bacterium]